MLMFNTVTTKTLNILCIGRIHVLEPRYKIFIFIQSAWLCWCLRNSTLASCSRISCL